MQPAIGIDIIVTGGPHPACDLTPRERYYRDRRHSRQVARVAKQAREQPFESGISGWSCTVCGCRRRDGRDICCD